MTRYYYSASIGIFFAQSENEILGELSRNNQCIGKRIDNVFIAGVFA